MSQTLRSRGSSKKGKVPEGHGDSCTFAKIVEIVGDRIIVNKHRVDAL